MSREDAFMTKLQKLGFRPAAGYCDASKVLIYKTEFYLEGDYKLQVLSALHDLRRLVATEITKVEEME